MKKQFIICCSIFLICAGFSAKAINLNIHGSVLRSGTPMRGQPVIFKDSVSKKIDTVYTNNAGTFSANFNTASTLTSGYIKISYTVCLGLSTQDTIIPYSSSSTTIGPLSLERCKAPIVPFYKVYFRGKVNLLPNTIAIRLKIVGGNSSNIRTNSLGEYDGFIHTNFQTGTIYAEHEDCHGVIKRSSNFTFTDQKDTLFTNVNFDHCNNPPYIIARVRLTGNSTDIYQKRVQYSIDNFNTILDSSLTDLGGWAKDTIPIAAGSSGIFYVRYKNCVDAWVVDTSHYAPPARYHFVYNFEVCPDSLPTVVTGQVLKNGVRAKNSSIRIIEWDDVNLKALNIDTLKTDDGFYRIEIRNKTAKYIAQGFLHRTDPNFGQFMPTYLPDEWDWYGARTMIYNKNNKLSNTDINLIRVRPLAGTNSVNGDVLDTSGVTPKLGPNTIIALFDASEKLIDFEYPNSNLEYELKQIDDAPYKLAALELGKFYSFKEIDFLWDNKSSIKMNAFISKDSTSFVKEIEFNGLNEVHLLQTTVYPNPANDKLTIEIAKGRNNLRVEIKEINGQLVALKNVTPFEKTIFNTRHWDSGMYVLEVVEKDGFEVKHRSSVIIQH